MSFSPRPIFAVDKGELITSMWVLLLVKFGAGGRGEREIWKNVHTSGKILPTPLISPSAFAIVFLQLTWFLIIYWQPKNSSGWWVEVLEQQSSSTHLPPHTFLLSYEVQCNWNVYLLGISCTYVLWVKTILMLNQYTILFVQECPLLPSLNY